MIKIEHPELSQISENYFNNVKSEIKNRIEFFERILSVVFDNAPANSLNAGPLHWKTRIKLINKLIERKMPTQNNAAINYDLVKRNNVQSWLEDREEGFRDILQFLNVEQNLRDIILAAPLDSISIDEELQAFFVLHLQNDASLISVISSVIDYGLFDEYAYDIAAALEINTCPYCNRNYINTVIHEKRGGIIRPTFDHFFPKSKHPFLALSFFNLIPSCYYCNSSLKTATTISHDTHLHPYIEGFGDACKFGVFVKDSYPSKSDPRNYKIFLLPGVNNQTRKYRQIFGRDAKEGNSLLFELEVIYNSHCDIVGELVVRVDRYSESQSDSLKSFFKELVTNQEEFYQFYFSNYIKEKKFNRRPMAKLTKDILQQLIPGFF